MSSPRTGISCRTACRWRARRAMRASKFMSRRGSWTARRRSGPKASFCIRCPSCAAGFPCFGTIATIRALRQIHRAVAPAIAHHVALQATVLGSLAALGRSVGCVNALTGLGYTFTSGNAKALLLRPIIGALLRLLLNRPKQFVLVQNPDDRDGVLSLGIAAGTHRADPGLRRRRRSAATDARAARPANRRLRRPAACRQGNSRTDPRPSAIAAARLECRAFARGNARPSQPRVGEQPGGRKLGPGARHHLARPCQTTFRRSGPAPISRSCRRGGRGCRKACWRPRPAAGR